MLLSLPALHLQTSEYHPLFQLPHRRYRPERESIWVGGKKWAGVWLPTGSADTAFCSYMTVVPGKSLYLTDLDLLLKSVCLLQGKYFLKRRIILQRWSQNWYNWVENNLEIFYQFPLFSFTCKQVTGTNVKGGKNCCRYRHIHLSKLSVLSLSF